ncbi:MAG: glycerol-3-phosphate 1-O-acyltransferase PlsY [Actinobacteria bacterium]|nr:glycerol-3-phosphate 1-O-acyltransferase PlsY [Actinomycetota bacterium]
MTEAVLVAGAYLLGSMPFGYWVVLLLKHEDIRNVGSGNIGATNVWRTYGKGYGMPIVLLDAAKGFVPALVGTLLFNELLGTLAGGAAMLGHWRPLFLRFQKGGKTVATAGGTFFGVAPVLGLIGLAIWIATFVATRYASVGSIATALVLPFVGLALGEPWPVIVFAAAAGVAVLLLHKANIARLRAGTESRFRLRRA